MRACRLRWVARVTRAPTVRRGQATRYRQGRTSDRRASAHRAPAARATGPSVVRDTTQRSGHRAHLTKRALVAVRGVAHAEREADQHGEEGASEDDEDVAHR